MKLYYDSTNGIIFYAVYDRDIFLFNHSTNRPLSEYVIDEVGDNKAICSDLAASVGKFDVENDGKYYIQDENIYMKDGWEEYVFDPLSI